MGKLVNYFSTGVEPVTNNEEINPQTNLPDGVIKGSRLKLYSQPVSVMDYGKGILPSEYSNYIGQVYPEEGYYSLSKQRAQNQTKSEQFLGFLNQAVVGEIGGGTIEGIGYLLDLDSYGKLFAGTEKEFGNWFSDVGKSLRTWSEDSTPIYRDPDAPSFDPGSFSWWMKNGKSVTSTLSLMLPSGAAVKGLSTIAKALGAFQKMKPMAAWAAKGISQAAISRHMENMMEASGSYEESYKNALSKGMSATDAKEYAAKTAAKTYSLDWAMFLQDIPQYLLLNRAFGKATVGAAEKSIAAAAKMGHKLAPVIGSKAAAIGWDMLGEGFEEGYQYIAAEEAKYLSNKLYDPSVESSFDERLNKYIKDGELWTSVAMGALGAGVMQTAGRTINDLIQGGDQQLKFIKDFSTRVKHANMEVRKADIIGSESAKEGAITNFESVLFEAAAATGSMDNAREMIERTANPTAEDMERFNITPDELEFLQENKDRLIKDANEFEKRWEDNAKKYEPNKAARVTRAEFFIDKFNTARKTYADKATDLEFAMVNFDKLSPEAKEIFDLSSDILSNNKAIALQQKRLDSTTAPLTTEQKKEAKTLIGKYEKKNKKLQTQIDKLEAERTDEERDEDKSIDIGGPYNVTELKDIKDIQNHAYASYLTNKEAETFADLTVGMWQEELKKILKEKAEPVKPKPQPEENAVDLDDYVTYTKDGNQFTGIVDSINENGDYVIIPTSKWSEDSKYATRPSGEPITVAKDKVVKDQRQYDEEDENFEPVGVDDLVTETESEEVIRTPQYMVSYYHKSTDPKYVSDNDELHRFLLESKGDLSGVSVEFFIDTTSDYAKKWFKDNGFTDKEIKYLSEGRSTKQYVKDFLLKEKIVGNIPVGVYLIKDNKKILANNSNIYLHGLNYKGITEEEKKSLSNLRSKILGALLVGNNAVSNNLWVGSGSFNNTPESRGKVTDRLGLSFNDIKVGVSRINGKVYIGNSTTVPGIVSEQEGTPYAPTKKTVNGRRVWVKLNPTKLTREHAEILWDAIKTRYTKGNGTLAKFPDERVTGLNVGEVIQMLSLFGQRKTDPDYKGHLTKRPHLRNKKLYVHSGSILYFGENGKVNIHEDNIDKDAANKEAFVKWATENKNYSIPIALSKMGVGLNTPLKRTFKIGSWENKPDEQGNYMTHAQFLATVPVDGKNQTALVSDLNQDMPFIRPNLIFAQSINDVAIVENPDKKRAMAPPKTTPQTTARKTATKKVIKNNELKDTITFMNLPVGTEIYKEYPETEDYQTHRIVPASRTVVGRIYYDKKLGVLLDIRPSLSKWNEKYSWLSMRDTKGNIVEESKALMDEYLTLLKQRTSNEGNKLIIDVSGTPEVEVVTKEEPEKAEQDKTKPVEDVTDVLNDILGIGMDSEIPASSTLVDIEKESKWIFDRFGKQNIEETNKLITIANTGKLAFSVFTADCIYVFEGAPEGALYHEAFHRVELGYLSEEDRQKVYTSARKHFNIPNATDSEISEKLAEGFRTYKLTGTKPKSRTIWQFFKDLYNFIYTFFTGNTKLSSTEISRLYDSIERGQYRYSKISADNFTRLSNLQTPMAVKVHGRELIAIRNHHELDKIVRYLTGILIETNNLQNLNDIKHIKMSKLFDHIDSQITRLASAIEVTEKQLEAGIIPTDQVTQKNAQLSISKNLLNVFKTIVDPNYIDLFRHKLADSLRRLNVKYTFDEDSYLENKESTDYKVLYDQASYEVNLKDNMLASVKFVIATLHKSAEIDPNIGIRDYVDFNSMWNSIMYHLHDVTDSDDMMDKIQELANDSYPYQELYDKIVNDKTGYLKEQVRQSIQRHRHDFVNFLIEMSKDDNAVKMDITDADVNKASKLLLSQWNLFFYANTSNNKTPIAPNKEKIDSIVDSYNKINNRVNKEMSSNNEQLKDPQSYIAAFTSLLNSTGMSVDEESVTALINDREGKSLSDKVYQTISTDFSHLFINIGSATGVTIRKMFSDEGIIKKLAEEYVKLHPETISDMILGPGGNQYYIYSQNSYVSDIIRKIKTDKSFLEDRLSKVYNDNSYYGNQLLESDKVREGVRVSTFSMVGEYGSDGQNYLNISSIEDYIFKLVALRKNIITFPTMADKRTYYLLKGLKTLQFDLVHDNGVTKIPTEAINILFGYAKSEKRRIDEAIKFRDNYLEAVHSGNEERINQILHSAVENYHYIVKGKEGIPTISSFEEGSAYKFHHFPSLNGRDNLVMDDTVKGEIRTALSDNIREELDYAETLGIIKSKVDPNTNRKVYSNVLLPGDIISEEVEKHGSEDTAIRNIIASFFVNTTIANIENEKLFSGDPAFYKTDKDTKRVIEDKVKRLSVLSSTGDNFANSVDNKDLTESSFNISTIATQKFTSAYYSRLKKLHVDLNKDVLKESHPDWSDEQIQNEAESIATTTLKPYTSVDPTDGQAWITPVMYRSLSIRLGEWSDDKEIAFNILTSGEDFSKDLEKEKLVLKVTFQPLKLVYFDLIHDSNLAIPTYHKASFATIFRAMGKGENGDNQIIEVLDRMERKGKYANQNLPQIDMLIADSATKVGNRAKSKIFDEQVEQLQDLSKLEIYQQNFEGLRRQLVTDPHDVDRTKTGTQFLKIALSNLDLDSDVYNLNGKQVSGRVIANEAFNCLNNLSDKGKKAILDKLGYVNGKVEKAKLVELLREDAEKSNSIDNLIDSLYMEDKDNMYLELDSLVDHKWIQSRIISLITKHTVDVKLPGNQFIQFSNMGIRSIKKDYTFEEKVSAADKHITWLEEATDDLPFLVNKKGEHVPMGCIVSINLFKHLIPNYDSITYEEKLEYLKTNPEIMGYRIPTQGQSSVFVLKVMGVYPETIGDTITLPSEFTALTGSDFDIDKVYAVRYNYTVSRSKKKLEKIKFFEGDTNDPKFLSKIYKERYSKVINAWKYIVETTNPTKNPKFDGFNSDQISTLEQIRELTDDTSVEEYITKLLDRNAYEGYYYEKIGEILLAKDILDESGFIANNLGKSLYDINSRKAVENRLLDTFFAVMRSKSHLLYTSAPLGGLTDILKDLAKNIRKSKDTNRPDMYYLSPRFNEDVKYTYTGGKEGIGPFALNNVHHIFSQIAGLEMTSGFGNVLHEKNNHIDLSQKYGKDNVLISGWLSALIDAHVDVAKDPYIMDLNVNPYTYNVISLLIRGGLGLKSFEFLAQPILVELAKEDVLGDKNNILPKQFEIPMTRRDGTVVTDEITGQTQYTTTTPEKYIKHKWASKLSKEDRDLINNLTIPEVANKIFEGDLRKDLLVKDPDKSEDKEFIMRQVLVSKLFDELSSLGNDLSDLIQASQVDTKKFGSNATELRIFLNKILKVYDRGAFTKESLNRVLPYDPYEGKAISVEGANFLGHYTENAVKLSLDVLGDFSIYGTTVFDSLLNKLLLVTQNTFNTDSKFINSLSDELFAAIASNFFKDQIGITSSNLNSFIEMVPYRLNKIKTNINHEYDDIQDNMFINYLYPMVTDDAVLPPSMANYVMVPIKSIKDKVDRDSMVASFRELIDHPNTEVSMFARQLFYYSFYTSGLRSRIYSFHNFISNDQFKQLRIKNPLYKDNKELTEYINISYNDDFMRKVLAEMKDFFNYVTYNYLVDEVIINNHYDKNIVKFIKGYQVKQTITEYKGKKYDKPIAVVLNTKGSGRLFLGKTEDGYPLYVPYIKMYDQDLGHILLKYIGVRTIADDSGVITNEPVYVTQNMRSYSRKGVVLKEFNMPKSIITKYNELNIITPAMEEEFLLHSTEGGKYTYVPREQQIFVNVGKDMEQLTFEFKNDDGVVDGVKGSIQMQEDNIALIVSGDKWMTTRTEGYHNSFFKGDGTYVMPDGTKVKIKHEGLVHVNSIAGQNAIAHATDMVNFYRNEEVNKANILEKYAIAEGFKSLEDMQLNSRPETKEFLAGKRSMHIYTIEVEPINTEENIVMAQYYEGDIKPEDNMIFVFGSNPVGVNGNLAKGTGGAALNAQINFGVKQGEIMNNRISDSGKAYGLVTVTAPGMKKSLTPRQITENIEILYETARNNPDKKFGIAFRNTAFASLNGYTGFEMIDMFNKAGEIPRNVIFSKEWVETGKLKIKEDGLQGRIEEETWKEREVEEFPFTSDERTKFSTEPKEVAELVDEFGVKTSDDWTKLTPEQRQKLEEKYKHCIGIL